MKEIPLYDKKKNIKCYFTVDDEDYEKVIEHKWSLSGSVSKKYVRNIKLGSLSRWLLNVTEKEYVVDHIDGNTMNNCRPNLRKVSYSVNRHNVTKKSNTSSQYIGVQYDKSANKWVVSCGRQFFGSYDDEKYAATVYNYLAKEKWGEHAKLNDVEEIIDFTIPVFKRHNVNVEDRGITFHKRKQKWQVIIKNIYYGSFTNKDDALNVVHKIRQEQREKTEKEHLEQSITRNEDGIAIIPIKKKGEIVDYSLVDDKYWYDLIKYSWWLSEGYPQSTIGYLHHYILPKKKGYLIDHIDNNTLDNRETKLRYATYSQNSQNRIKAKRDLPIGVHKTKHKFRSLIMKNKKLYSVGTFNTPEEAAKAYDIKAVELFGIHAKLNYDISLYQ